MKSLIIAAKDLKVFSRDRTGLMMNILMPLLLIVVLGACLGGMFNTQVPTIKQFEFAIVDEDGGQMVTEFRNVTKSGALRDMMSPVDLSRAEAESRIRDGKLAGAVVFPKGHSAAIMSGEPAQLEVLADPGSATQASIIKALAQGFSDRLLSIQFAMLEAAKGHAGTSPTPPPGVSPAAFQAQLAAQMAQLTLDIDARLQALTPAITEQYSKKGAQLSAMQYYAISMSVMFLGFVGMTGLQSIIYERERQTILRLFAAVPNRMQFVIGKFLGVLLIAATQFLVLLLGTHFIYRVDWGTNWPGLFAMAMAYAFTVSGLATLVSALSSNSKSAINVWVLVIQLTSALGGLMVPLAVFPEGMRRIASFLPNNWALNGFLRLATGEPLSALTPTLLWLVGIGAVCLALGSRRLARQ